METHHNVLIVDEDADQRALLGELLESEACAVTEARNGHEARQRAAYSDAAAAVAARIAASMP